MLCPQLRSLRRHMREDHEVFDRLSQGSYARVMAEHEDGGGPREPREAGAGWWKWWQEDSARPPDHEEDINEKNDEQE